MTESSGHQPPVCESCGESIPRETKWSVKSWLSRKFCSTSCRYAARRVIEIDYEVTAEGCWKWLGRIDANGYGKAYDPSLPEGQRIDWAHRVSFRKHRGAVPEGFELDHECENTACVNPDHLCPVTKEEHVRRTVERRGSLDRQRDAARLRSMGLTYGQIANVVGLAAATSAYSRVSEAIKNGLVDPDEIPSQKFLTDDDREAIRWLVDLGVPRKEVAAWFEVDASQISRISQGKRSGHG